MSTKRAKAVFDQRSMNSGQVEMVERIKNNAAHLWVTLDEITADPGNTETMRLVSIAKTDLETCVMSAVKAVSRQTPTINVDIYEMT